MSRAHLAIVQPSPAAQPTPVAAPARRTASAEAIAAGDVRYIARVFAQVCLPYSNPGDALTWQRTNGDVSLTMQTGTVPDASGTARAVGLPYGLYPRLMLMYLATAATRTQSRVIELPSTRALMRELDIPKSSGGARVLNDQILRLAACSITIVDQRTPESTSMHWWRFASGLEATHASQGSEPAARVVTLSEEFFDSITTSPIPVDHSIVNALRGRNSSGLALDVYWWLTHRTWKVRSVQRISWAQLENQFGNQYAPENSHKWRQRFLDAVGKVVALRPDINVTWDDHVFVVLPRTKAAPALTEASRRGRVPSEWTVIRS